MNRRLILAVLPLCISLSLAAQDTRTVTEPVFPALCATLDAQLHSIPRLAPAAGRTLAESDESKLDTARIQKAIDQCGKGRGVLLRASVSADAFLTGPLELRSGVTLIVDKGATLFASRDPELYATAPGSCGLVNESGHGCKPIISADHVSGAAIMGDGVIDGRGGEKLLGKSVSWWDLAEQARAGGRQQVSRILVADYADNFTLYRITLRNSPNFHVSYNHGNGFTVWGLKIDTPQRLARNTDGVDPGNGSRNVTITHSFIRTGDDNVAIKGGPGGATNMTISHNHFYWGHGMSIGSETDGGVSKIRVFDLSLDGPDNGLRIKSNGSRGGLTQDVLYDDVCIRNSPNPITLDTAYTASGTVKGNSPPTMAGITLRNVRVSGGGKISFNGYDQQHRIAATLDGILLTDQASYSYSLNHADLRLGPGPVNLQLPVGDDSTVQGTPASGSLPSCAEKFVDFPAQTLTIRLLNGKSGRPVTNKNVTLRWSPGDFLQGDEIYIGKDGIGKAEVPDGAEAVSIVGGPKIGKEPYRIPFIDCNATYAERILIAQVLKNGYVPGNNCSHKSAVPQPGEIVFWAKPNPWWMPDMQ